MDHDDLIKKMSPGVFELHSGLLLLTSQLFSGRVI